MADKPKLYKRPQKALELFKSMFATSEDELAFKLKHNYELKNDPHYGLLCVRDESGQFHSYDGMPAKVHHDGTMSWYWHGKLFAIVECSKADCTLTVTSTNLADVDPLRKIARNLFTEASSVQS